MKTPLEIAKEDKESRERRCSPVICAVCDEKMFFGDTVMIDLPGSVTIQKCRCQGALMMRGICNICGTAAEIRTKKAVGIRLKCTCGHKASVEKDKLAETHKI